LRIVGSPELESPSLDEEVSQAIAQFLSTVREEQFRRQYFSEVPLATLQAVASQFDSLIGV
jgi:single-stranded-DNA-specific exonuclease